MAAVGLELPTSHSGVRHSTTEPPRSPEYNVIRLFKYFRLKILQSENTAFSDRKTLLFQVPFTPCIIKISFVKIKQFPDNLVELLRYSIFDLGFMPVKIISFILN